MASGKKAATAPPEAVELYDKMVATIPDIRRKGSGVPNTTLNGNMFSFLHASGEVALRLPQQMREEFLTRFSTKLFDGYGAVQKEYVVVPQTLMEETEQVAPYFAASYEYCKSLKPK